jgi:hypothetical protein
MSNIVPPPAKASKWKAQAITLVGAHKNLLLAFFLCSVLLCGFAFTRQPDFRLELEMSSSVLSTAQLFFDAGRGMNEKDSTTARVSSHSLDEFMPLIFHLPAENISQLRFDPLDVPGQIILRNVRVMDSTGVLLRIPQAKIKPLNQIEGRVDRGDEVEFSTSPQGTDPSLTLELNRRLRLKRISFWSNSRTFLVGFVPLSLFALLVIRGPFAEFERRLDSATARTVEWFHHTAKRLSGDGFIIFDAYSIVFYCACLVVFALLSLADLNGSSVAMYKDYGHGPGQETWLGSPLGSRSDEWGYVTPDILNQSFRPDRFAVRRSELGDHSIALLGNIPVRHFSTIFRPQFWAFFFLPVDYAFAVYWQFKGLVLLTGVFTWLLLITRSTLWAVTGSLWFFFSAFTQWSYSWPSALPEMVGLLCWTMVLGCYLTVGRHWPALLLAAFCASACAINFALCGYPPHLVPLAWIAGPFWLAWFLSNRELIFSREAVRARVVTGILTAAVIGIAGLLLYVDLHQAIKAIAQTVYPGQRALRGASMSPDLLASHFLQWTETETNFPDALGNMCEGSGFLWFAPATLFCLKVLKITRFQKYAMAALWGSFGLLLAWLLLPIPAAIASLLFLNQSAGARMLPALGLANVAIVSLSAATIQMYSSNRNRRRTWIRGAVIATAAIAAFFLLLWITNAMLGHFFTTGQVLFSGVLAAIPVTLLLMGRRRLLALAIVVPNVLAFGSVNPVQRGLTAITSSELFRFVQDNPTLKNGKWIIFSDAAISSGFLAATGCDVYTGTHYLPDVDHFQFFAAEDLDLHVLNRLGYLNAHLRSTGEPARVTLWQPIIVRWDVSPSDPILRTLGIRYVAFDSKPPAIAAHLIPLSSHAIDGFWLYRYR